MVKIAICNLKGGVGKSTTTVNLAYELAYKRDTPARVLIVDLDKQANTSKFFGALSYDRPSVADALNGTQPVGKVVTRTAWGLIDILPSNMSLLRANRQIMLDCTMPQQTRIRRMLKEIAATAEQYDYVLMDCAPDVDMSAINALCAAEWVIIPVDCDQWAMDGQDQLMEQVLQVKAAYNERLDVLGLLATKVTATKESRRVIKDMASTGLPVFEAQIRYTVKVREAMAAGMPVGTYAPACTAAADYDALAREIARKTAKPAAEAASAPAEKAPSISNLASECLRMIDRHTAKREVAYGTI